MQNAWMFTADDKHWLPLPASALPAPQREIWLDAAVVRMATANLTSEPADLAAMRRRCIELLDAAPGGEACLYFPVMEPDALVVRIETLTPDEFPERAGWWSREDAQTTSVEVTELDHPALSQPRRVMRVDKTASTIMFSVAFLATSEDLGIVVSATTGHPLLAGQFAGVAVGFFETFERRVEHVVG
jgi:hypothetical protein